MHKGELDTQKDTRTPTFIGMDSDGGQTSLDMFHTPLRTPATRRIQTELGRNEQSLTETPASVRSYTTPILASTIDLNPDELRRELSRQDVIVREQADIISKLRDDLNRKIVDESIVISTSNKLSCQETRVHSRDVELLQLDLEKGKKSIRKLRDQLAFEESRNQGSLREIEAKNTKIEELKDEANALREDVLNLKKREVEWGRREAEMKSQFSQCEVDLRSQIAYLQGKINNGKDVVTDLRNKLEEYERRISLYKKSIDETSEDGKRRSDEIREREGVLAKKETELMIRRSLDVNMAHLNRHIETSLVNTLTTHIINVQPHHSNCQAIDLVKMGALTATNEFLQRQVSELKEREEELTKLLDLSREQHNTTKTDLEELQKKLVEIEGNAEMTHKYLLDENTKVKQQKAEMRCEFMELQRNSKRLEEQMESIQKNSSDTSERDELEEKLRKSGEEIQKAEKRENDLMKRIDGLDIKIAQLEKQLEIEHENKEHIVGLMSERDSLRDRLLSEEKKNGVLVKGVEDLNEQVEAVLRAKKRIENRLVRAQEDVVNITSQLRMKEKEMEGVKIGEAELVTLRADNERLKDKVDYLNEELRETHTDYREELSQLALKLTESKAPRKENTEELEAKQAKIDELNRDLTQVRSQWNASKRQLEELRQDNRKLTEQIAEVRARDRTTNEENSKLREGLVDAVTKAERYKREMDEAKEIAQIASDERERSVEKMRKLELELSDLNEVIVEKERLIRYLQSQTNAHKMPKLKSKPSNLLYHPSDSSMEAMDTEIIELENEKAQLRERLEKRRQELSVRKGSTSDSSLCDTSTPLGTVAVPSAPPRTPLTQMQSLPNISGHAPSQISEKSKTVGKMRHDIPHKWKSQLGFALRQIKCSMCFEGIARVGYAVRCSECEVVVHRHCVPRVTNTCGFPTQFAAFYHDNSTHSNTQSVPIVNMNGWVRIYQSTDSQWRSAFSLMENGSISFYDSEGLAGNLNKAFLSLDLEREPWTVRALGEGPNGVKEGYGNCIQIRSNGQCVYMLCPTEDCTARWTKCLQLASRRRHFLTRRPSSFSVSSLLLALDSPHTLTINTVLLFDDYLLIGAQEGLFATPIHDLRTPFMVTGVGSVHALEPLSQLGFIACVVGKQRQLCLLSTSQLRIELPGKQPAIKPQLIPGHDYIHLLAYHEEGSNRYLLAADTMRIHILQYKRDFFTAHLAMNTPEPTTCILSAHGGIYYGADSFYFASSFHLPSPIVTPLVSSHLADYPLAVMKISEDEVLLAFQNYGMFVNKRGEKTREDTVEWEQTPMEFVFTSPYLYIVHFDSLEIVQVYENTGIKSRTISEEREVYGAKQGHLVGTRPNGEVFVALGSKERVELHSFNALHQKRGVSKRKGLASAFSIGTLDKRSKIN